MRSGAAVAARWLLLGLTVVAAAEGAARAGLPTPYLFASFAAGIAYALLVPAPLVVPGRAAILAQGVIGVTAGSYLERSTLTSVGGHAGPILGVCVLTVALSVASGLVLARFADVDRPTAAFGMIAGGAAGIVSISRELGADERLVAVMQYVRVLIIVAVTPVIAIAVFGMNRSAPALASGENWNIHGFAYVAATLVAGLWVATLLRLPVGTILGPMLVAAIVSLVDRALVAPIPMIVADLAFSCIGLDVGLRFTRKALREAGSVLPRAVAVIVAMIVVSAAFGLALASLSNVSMLDGYLATTPGGISAVLAMAVGSRTNTSFIVSVQVVRTFLMLLAAPPLARWLSARERTDAES